jgi:hypothetical protein
VEEKDGKETKVRGDTLDEVNEENNEEDNDEDSDEKSERDEKEQMEREGLELKKDVDSLDKKDVEVDQKIDV